MKKKCKEEKVKMNNIILMIGDEIQLLTGSERLPTSPLKQSLSSVIDCFLTSIVSLAVCASCITLAKIS
jgi:hypothetical protein